MAVGLLLWNGNEVIGMKAGQKRWALFEWRMALVTEVTQLDINLKSANVTELKRNNKFSFSLKAGRSR